MHIHNATPPTPPAAESGPHGRKYQSLRKHFTDVAAVDMTPLCSLRRGWWRNAYLVAALVLVPATLVASAALWLHVGRTLAPFQALGLALVCAAVLLGGVAALLRGAARHAFGGCMRLQAAAVAEARPDVVVASSFGGAVAVNLVAEGLWSGPTLLLAPAQERCRKVFAKVGYHLPPVA